MVSKSGNIHSGIKDLSCKKRYAKIIHQGHVTVQSVIATTFILFLFAPNAVLGWQRSEDVGLVEKQIAASSPVFGRNNPRRDSSYAIQRRQTLVGPNVCDDECCEGWVSNGTSLCITPVCHPRCMNGGRCIRPNQCLCPSQFRGRDCSIKYTRMSATVESLPGKRKRGPRQTVVHIRYSNPREYDSRYRQASQYNARVVCSRNTCFNGGTCIDGSCVCRDGYMGDRCEKVILVQTSVNSVIPGDTSKLSNTQVAWKLCKALCVHGTCHMGGGAICRCHRGYHGTMCTTRRRSSSRSSHTVNPSQMLSGLKYSNNFLRPVVTYSNNQITRQIPTISSTSSDKYQKCYKRYRTSLCGLSFSGRLTKEACCESNVGDAWGPSCIPCHKIASRKGVNVLPPTSRPANRCPMGFTNTNGFCEDIDECRSRRNICQHGRCINSRGGFWCKCDRGYYQHMSHKLCLPNAVQLRKQSYGVIDKCYLSLDSVGECTGSFSLTKGSKVACCCSIGVAWGSSCIKCPEKESAQYKTLCDNTVAYRKPILNGAMTPMRTTSKQGIIITTTPRTKSTRPSTTTVMPSVIRLLPSRDRSTKKTPMTKTSTTRTTTTSQPTTQPTTTKRPVTMKTTTERTTTTTPTTTKRTTTTTTTKPTTTTTTTKRTTTTTTPPTTTTTTTPKTTTTTTTTTTTPTTTTTTTTTPAPTTTTTTRPTTTTTSTTKRTTTTTTKKPETTTLATEEPAIVTLSMEPDETTSDIDLFESEEEDYLNYEWDDVDIDGDVLEEDENYEDALKMLFEDIKTSTDLIGPDEEATDMEPEDLKPTSPQQEDLCIPNPCKNGATCETGMGYFYCDCPAGFTGTDCATDINECETEEDVCGGSEICVNYEGYHLCEKCKEGYAPTADGRSCEDIDECLDSSICGNGKCQNTVGAYDCMCRKGYVLSGSNSCVDVNECATGTPCGEYARCRNTEGSYRCLCPKWNQIFDQRSRRCILNDEPRETCYSSTMSCKNVLSSNVTKQECCCTIGRSWGPCNAKRNCPRLRTAAFKRLCPNGRGVVPGDETVDVIDINECELFGEGNVCRHGKCNNSFGAYRCECFKGYYYNPRIQACDDINECRSGNKCMMGYCINSPGSFRCKCPRDSVLKEEGYRSICEFPQSSRKRLPARGRSMYRTIRQNPPQPKTKFRDHCYRNSRCNIPLPIKYTYEDCCCIVGTAWGNACSKCPGWNTEDRTRLCGRTPSVRHNQPPARLEDFSSNRKEAEFHEQECGIAGGCENGKCLRAEDGFTCECEEGYVLDNDIMSCIDIDECNQIGKVEMLCMNGKCINLPGSFSCTCNEGYTASISNPTVCLPDSEHEIDIDNLAEDA